MKVPFADLGKTTAAVRPELDAAVARVLDRGWYVLGDEGRQFERAFAAWIGAGHALGVGSGTDAIELALRALGIGPGDEVVTQANTCVPTVAAIERAGAAPVLCDVEPAAGTMEPASLADALTPATRAVVPVHLYGQCADVDAIVALVEDRGVVVVEDCAQAHGAQLRGRTAGTMGALAAFSFYPTKNLGALGDGGAVVTSDDALAERLALLRQYGQTDRYHHVAHGVNSRLDELQAAMLRAKLDHLDAANKRRRVIAATYDDALAGTPVTPLDRLPDRTHVYHLYVVRSSERDAFIAELGQRGVGALIHYPVPIHGHEPYRELGERGVTLENSETLAGEIVSLPLYPEMTDDTVEYVAGATRDAALATG